jgi:iron(II)-dependent oxidoreductase
MTSPLAVPRSIDSPGMRRAGGDLLSVALMDARNHTLRLLAAFEQAIGIDGTETVPDQTGSDCAGALWLAGHIGWFAEYWIGRNTQRSRGVACPAQPTRLASIEPMADPFWDASQQRGSGRAASGLPDATATRAWLRETLEGTLELLDKAPGTDDGLYFFRLALFHEDWRGEQLVAMAQALGVPLQVPPGPAGVVREPLLVPATRWQMGTPEGGFMFDNEGAQHAESVPEFEIDAQPVTWSQYVEFVDDSGYDREELWSPEGWQWLERVAAQEGRRGPRHVDEIGTASGAVMQLRFGKRVRAAGNQPATHVSWWEADAWARWAGRRLATEIEWEIAAHTAAGRGFRWGEVHEWTANMFRPYPGFVAGPWVDYSVPWFGKARAMRGASFATRARMKHPGHRGFALPGRDDHFSGFRTCSI